MLDLAVGARRDRSPHIRVGTGVTRRRPALTKPTMRPTLPFMALEFAYRFREQTASSGFRDLDDVVLTVAVVSDDGIPVPAGTEGTIVSVHGPDWGDTYVVEFAEPEWTLATVKPDEIRLAESAKR